MLTKPVIDAIPSLEPLVAALRETVDETTHQPIEEAYDRVIATVMRNPRDLKATIEREADTFAAKVDIKTPVEHATLRAQQQSEELKKRLSSLTGIRPQIDHHVTEIPPLPDPHLPPPNSPDRITSGPSNLPKAPGPKPLERAQEILKELQDRHLSKFRVWRIPL